MLNNVYTIYVGTRYNCISACLNSLAVDTEYFISPMHAYMTFPSNLTFHKKKYFRFCKVTSIENNNFSNFVF